MEITKNVILQTKRLNISIPTIDSLDNWYKLQSDPDVMKFIGDGSPRNEDGARVNLQKSIKHFDDYGFCFFDIFEKETGKFIGEAGLIYLAFDKKNKDVEVGYTLLKEYWGKGYATELAETFIKWGFDKFHHSKIVACCYPANTASSNVMKKCGLKYQGKYLYNGKNECDIYQINNISIKIDLSVVRQITKKQFPQYSDLLIKPVDNQGHDNRTFRLGDKMLIRMPSAEEYVAKVEIEQKWLPKLAPYISLKIPKPLHMGLPSESYPFNWSIYQWIEGKSLNQIPKNELNLEGIAKDLASFIKELHLIDITNAPKAGEHNFYRGCHISVYEKQARENIEELKDVIDTQKALLILETALNSKWQKEPVWIHGDLAIGNIVTNDKKLNAIIDFGGIAIGDPACDLVLYWSFFEGESRNIFKSILGLDENTWNRARGWALWKACFELVEIKGNKKSQKYINWLTIIEDILNYN